MVYYLVDREEPENNILEVLKEKYIRTEGHNGNKLDDVDRILNISIDNRNAFLQRMIDDRKIMIRDSANEHMIMLPK
ncbi:hypothetical protein [Chryseobacterium lathyri]|uniref:hypothetical protein n=1 Tax=Chryseobacterium lathyri TaxID=395933 RepID=UPI001CBCDB75|nr:hypothetical protein [Chryseobacterium lathyri]